MAEILMPTSVEGSALTLFAACDPPLAGKLGSVAISLLNSTRLLLRDRKVAVSLWIDDTDIHDPRYPVWSDSWVRRCSKHLYRQWMKPDAAMALIRDQAVPPASVIIETRAADGDDPIRSAPFQFWCQNRERTLGKPTLGYVMLSCHQKLFGRNGTIVCPRELCGNLFAAIDGTKCGLHGLAEVAPINETFNGQCYTDIPFFPMPKEREMSLNRWISSVDEQRQTLRDYGWCTYLGASAATSLGHFETWSAEMSEIASANAVNGGLIRRLPTGGVLVFESPLPTGWGSDANDGFPLDKVRCWWQKRLSSHGLFRPVTRRP